MEISTLYTAYINDRPSLRSIVDKGSTVELGKAIDEGTLSLKRDPFSGVGLLDVVVALGRTDLAKCALDKGAPVNPYGKDKDSPLDIAVDRKDGPMTALLVEAGADIFYRTPGREPPAFRFPEAIQEGIDARWSKPEVDRQAIDPSSIPRDRQIPCLKLPHFSKPHFEEHHEHRRNSYER